MQPSTTPPDTTPCPRCSAPASGRFCASCGAALEQSACASCAAPLSPGARFCHKCGTAVGSTTPAAPTARGFNDAIPWAVAAIALLALIALVAGQRFASPRGSAVDGSSNSLPVAGLDFGRDGSAGAGARAPDISNMTPREMTTRLYNRVMTLAESGDKDSAQTIALNMAVPAYGMIPTLDADLRYEMGRIAEVLGAPEVAKAQADTILAAQPKHLLGLVLAAMAARMRGDETSAKKYDRALLAAETSERAKKLQEYADHAQDIDHAIAEARRAG